MSHANALVLMYHALGSDQDAITIRPSTFEWQMRWLHERRYPVVSLSRLVGQLHDDPRTVDRGVAITFDDGLSSVYTAAFPVLLRYGFPATVFVVPGYCGGRNTWPSQPAGVARHQLMTWSQIQEMDRCGIQFGSHTASHEFLDRLSGEALGHEIVDSKGLIEDRLGHAIELFAYPYGRWSDAGEALVRGTYRGACTTQVGLVGAGSDPWMLPRVEAQYLAWRPVFERIANPLFPLYLDLRRTLRGAAATVTNRPWR